MSMKRLTALLRKLKDSSIKIENDMEAVSKDYKYDVAISLCNQDYNEKEKNTFGINYNSSF